LLHFNHFKPIYLHHHYTHQTQYPKTRKNLNFQEKGQLEISEKESLFILREITLEERGIF